MGAASLSAAPARYTSTGGRFAPVRSARWPAEFRPCLHRCATGAAVQLRHRPFWREERPGDRRDGAPSSRGSPANHAMPHSVGLQIDLTRTKASNGRFGAGTAVPAAKAERRLSASKAALTGGDQGVLAFGSGSYGPLICKVLVCGKKDAPRVSVRSNSM